MPVKQEINHYTDKSSFGYHKSFHPTLNYVVHSHNYYEIYYFLEGNIEYLVDQRTYHPKPNSLLLMQPYVMHGVKIKDESCYKRYFLHFDPDILPPEHRDFLLSIFPPFHTSSNYQSYFENTEPYQIGEYFEALKDCAYQPESVQKHTIVICIQALLSQIKLMCLSEAPSDTPVSTVAENSTVSEIIGYITKHFQKPLTLDAISDHFSINKHHMNRIFKKAVGTTVFDYLIRTRIQYAQALIRNGQSIQNASLEAGFSTYSAFYRSYVKTVGHSPSEDRISLHSDEGSSLGFQQNIYIK